MYHVPTVLVAAQHFDKTNFKEIEESVYVFDICTSVRIDTNYCEYLQLTTNHRDLFIVITSAFHRALTCLMLAILPRSASEMVVVDEALPISKSGIRNF